MLSSLNINDIGHGPLSLVLSFLDPPSLATVSSTNKSMNDIAHLHAWRELERHYYLMENTLSCGKTAAQRCHRFYLAQQFCIRMQEASMKYFDYTKSDCRSPSYKPGYGIKTILPTLNMRVFRMNQAYEFFVRLATRHLGTHDHQCLVWQGFLPCQKTGFNELSLDTRKICQNKDLSTLLRQADLPSSSPALHVELKNLTITVAAMESFPSAKPSLILATGGISRQEQLQSDEHALTMSPRNARPYSIRNDEDWINADLRINRDSHGKQTLQRIILSHHW